MSVRQNLKLGILGFLLGMIPREVKRRLGVHLGVPDLRWSLMDLKRFGFQPRQVMDVGAFRGDWTRVCREVFPESFVLCIEPQDSVQEELRGLAARDPNIRVAQVLLGKESRANVPLRENGPGTNLFDYEEPTQNCSMTTIDTLIDKGIAFPPEFLKLDVQGYELEALKGFIRHFGACQVIQCELSLLPLHPAIPLFHEMVAYLYQRGFVLFDLDEIIRSPSDGAVWQVDALFCRFDSPLRTLRSWERGP